MTNIDWFIAECRALVTLYRLGSLPACHLEERFNLAAANHGVA